MDNKGKVCEDVDLIYVCGYGPLATLVNAVMNLMVP
jgi:hypothetical protein